MHGFKLVSTSNQNHAAVCSYKMKGNAKGPQVTEVGSKNQSL